MRLRRWAALAVLILASCAMSGPVSDVQPGTRPSLDSDEASLWMKIDEVEEELGASARVIRDPGLNAYVGGVVCRLAPTYCDDIRVYVMQVPYFNANMAPNGAMQVWSGLLLRVENEAQMAYVLGHEIGHFKRRHSLQRWRDAKSKSNASGVFRLLTAAAGVGFVGYIGELAAYASILSYSRDQEREADDLGLELMAESGYDPAEAAKVWRMLLDEKAAGDDSAPIVFLSSHPGGPERIATLASSAQQFKSGDAPMRVGTEDFRAATAPFRSAWLRDDLRRRKLDESEILFKRLLLTGEATGGLQFYLGELYRLRAEPGDGERAVERYRLALATGDAPPATYRSLGRIHLSQNRAPQARDAFNRYLELRPDADDRAMIEHQINSLK